MSAFVSPRRAGVVPPYLMDHKAQAACPHVGDCTQLRRQRPRSLLAIATAVDLAQPLRTAAPVNHHATQGASATAAVTRGAGNARRASDTSRALRSRWRGLDPANTALTATVANSDSPANGSETRAAPRPQAWRTVGVVA
ncbi:hypothetical protein GGR62_004144 [Xanthomonas campestris]|nr:hypothetical protein [Xanthomonas sp. 3075]